MVRQQIKDEVRQSLKTEGACKWEQGRLFQELQEDHGMTDQEIADEFGIDKQTVIQRRLTSECWEENRFSSLSWQHHNVARSFIVRDGDG